MQRPLILPVIVLVLAALVWKGSALFDSGDSATVGPEAPDSGALTSAEQDLAPPPPANLESASTAIDRERAAPSEPEAKEEEDAPAATTGTLVLRATLADGTPVAGVVTFLSHRRAERIGQDAREYTTGDDGLARAEELLPGKYTVFCLNGPHKSAEVVAGQEVEVLLELKDVVDVHGVVRSPNGDPVGGADVWLASWRTDWLGTHRLARTAADGTFSGRHVASSKSLGASADGFAPSALVDLEKLDAERSPVEVELVLQPGGGALRGRVLDPAGRPVADARVAAGASPTEYSMRNDSTIEEFWCPRVVTTDESGTFAFVGLEAGEVPLHVLASDYPEYEGTVEVPAGGTATRDVQLVNGMSVRGVAKDESGGPVAQALVLALDEPFVDPFPTQGPTEKGSPFHRPATRTDESGAFHLKCLPPGDVHLYASKGTSYWDDGDFVGTVQETLNGAAGETLEWNPVLSKGHQIRGRVLYADGEPMGNVFISATDDEGKRLTEHAEKDGRFSIPGLEARAYKVAVQLWDPPDDAPPLDQEDVWPSESELVLTASFSKVTVEKGVARARIDDVAERVDGKGSIVFAHSRGWYYSEEEDGVFSSKLPPDRYQARVMNGDTIVGTSEWFELRPGEERDLGAILTRGAGTLVLRVRRPADEPERSVNVKVETGDDARTTRRPLDAGVEELVFEDLLEGSAVVTVSGLKVVRETRTVAIEAAAPTTVEIELQSAAQVQVEVTSAVTEGFGTVTVRLLGEGGRVYGDVPFYERWGAELPLRASFFAPLGRFTVEATSTTGLTASQEVVVESLEDDLTSALTLE